MLRIEAVNGSFAAFRRNRFISEDAALSLDNSIDAK
jgi:hypothetical protein